MVKHNHVAIGVVVLLHQVLGFVWYSPVLFLSPWIRALGKSIDQLDRSDPIVIIASFLASIVASYVVSWLVQVLNILTFKQGVGFGSVLWIGIAAPGLVVHYAAAGIPWTVIAIDALNVLVLLAFTCGVLAAWRPHVSGTGESSTR